MRKLMGFTGYLSWAKAGPGIGIAQIKKKKKMATDKTPIQWHSPSSRKRLHSIAHSSLLFQTPLFSIPHRGHHSRIFGRIVVIFQLSLSGLSN
jgi:hypothetical protein